MRAGTAAHDIRILNKYGLCVLNSVCSEGTKMSEVFGIQPVVRSLFLLEEHVFI